MSCRVTRRAHVGHARGGGLRTYTQNLCSHGGISEGKARAALSLQSALPFGGLCAWGGANSADHNEERRLHRGQFVHAACMLCTSQRRELGQLIHLGFDASPLNLDIRVVELCAQNDGSRKVDVSGVCFLHWAGHCMATLMAGCVYGSALHPAEEVLCFIQRNASASAAERPRNQCRGRHAV